MTIQLEFVLPYAPERVWAIVGDPARADWVPGVATCQYDGEVRRFVMQGAGRLAERILERDPIERRLEYSVIDSRPALQHHLASIQVADHPTGSLLRWQTSVQPVSVEPFIRKSMEAAAAQLAGVLQAAEVRFEQVAVGDQRLRVAVQGSGPLILCVHGWPELWYSWRHQMACFAQAGYTVAAMDVRGYGGSSKPEAVAAYTMRELTGDVAAVVDALGEGPAVLFGHDWGAPIVWNTALLQPQAVRAVAGLSVPYRPAGDVSMLDAAAQIYADRFFYQLYFQTQGVAETELEADVRGALRKIYYTLSGDAPLDAWIAPKPQSAALLDGMTDPQPFPAWLGEADLEVFVAAFEAGGFRGPINRYRAQRLDFEQLSSIRGRHVSQPACFIGGERDVVRHMFPGLDLYQDAGAACDDFRGGTIVPGAGHWVQQEAPDAVNAALAAFLEGL
jgi:pimeloyl-ACP methyl ester carboxylesterase